MSAIMKGFYYKKLTSNTCYVDLVNRTFAIQAILKFHEPNQVQITLKKGIMTACQYCSNI